MSYFAVTSTFIISVIIFVLFFGLVLSYTCTGGSFKTKDYDGSKCFKFVDYGALSESGQLEPEVSQETTSTSTEEAEPTIDDILTTTLQTAIIESTDTEEETPAPGPAPAPTPTPGPAPAPGPTPDEICRDGTTCKCETEWTDWGACNVVTSLTKRSRCRGPNDFVEEVKDCTWCRVGNVCHCETEWTPWSSCDTSIMKMKRSKCNGPGDLVEEEMDCRCQYGEWGECSKTCGPYGYRMRDREILEYPDEGADQTAWENGISCNEYELEPCNQDIQCLGCCESEYSMYEYGSKTTIKEINRNNIYDIYRGVLGNIVGASTLKLQINPDGDKLKVNGNVYNLKYGASNTYTDGTRDYVFIRYQSGMYAHVYDVNADENIVFKRKEQIDCSYCD